jgi:hypothetical protein
METNDDPDELMDAPDTGTQTPPGAVLAAVGPVRNQGTVAG